MELSMRLLFLLLAFFPLAAMCKPVLTATCGEPVGTRYDQENGVLLTKPDGFSGVTPVFILDDEKPKVITFIWGAAAWVQKELDQKVSAQEAVIVSTSKDKITAVRVEECQSALKSIHLTASNNVQQISKVIPFLAPFYAV
jgi:hypothetical protein